MTKRALLAAALIVALPASFAGGYSQRVTFRFVSGPNGASYIVQPMLPMKLRITKLDASQTFREGDFAHCEVFNPKTEPDGAHIKCGDVEFRVTGMIFEVER